MPHTPHTKSPSKIFIDSTSPDLHTSYTDSTSDKYIGMSKMSHTPYTNLTNFFLQRVLLGTCTLHTLILKLK